MATDTMGQRIEDVRRELGISQAELAERAGIALITVSRLENDAAKNPRIGTIQAIAAALGSSPGWLLFGDGDSGESDDPGEPGRR